MYKRQKTKHHSDHSDYCLKTITFNSLRPASAISLNTFFIYINVSSAVSFVVTSFLETMLQPSKALKPQKLFHILNGTNTMPLLRLKSKCLNSSFRKLFSLHCDGEKVKLKATEKQIIPSNEKQITVLQQVPTYFHPIQGSA